MSVLRIAVLSDLHAYDDPPSAVAPSHLCIQDNATDTSAHPVRALNNLIVNEGLAADLVLCPGDLTDKAHPAALQYAWQAVNQVKVALGAQLLAASTGNHDVDSHHKYNTYDPTEALKGLSPNYPLPDLPDEMNDRYWSRGYVVVDRDTHRLAVVNSSAFHGGAPEEAKRGRVTDGLLDRLRKELSAGPQRTANILLCHHHPHQHSEIMLGEEDIMRNGQLLLDVLGSGKYGRWLVVHGHKHHPKITYASGGSSSAVVLAAGSLSAQLYARLGSVARNQFYVISLPLDAVGFVGTVRAWDWTPFGWKAATRESGLPSSSGFGMREDTLTLSHRVAATLTEPRMDWAAVTTLMPDLNYLLPQDYALLRAILESTHGISIIERDGEPIEIGRAP